MTRRDWLFAALIAATACGIVAVGGWLALAVTLGGMAGGMAITWLLGIRS